MGKQISENLARLIDTELQYLSEDDYDILLPLVMCQVKAILFPPKLAGFEPRD